MTATFGVAHTTIRRYLDVLAQTYMVLWATHSGAELERLVVVHAGRRSFDLAPRIHAVAFRELGLGSEPRPIGLDREAPATPPARAVVEFQRHSLKFKSRVIDFRGNLPS